MRDEKHGIQMGKVFEGCDDGINNLSVDWDGSPVNYTCFSGHPLPVDPSIKSVEHCDNIAANYYPQHHCMDEPIVYNTSLPTFGDHRPLWPVFGEYKFVPIQRWLHNIEHGAVIMLYHPCANKIMVSRLRALVTACIGKHIITPYNQLAEDRPLALITWGCRLTMNQVVIDTVVDFIQKNSMKGPEGNYTKQGQYGQHLIKRSQLPLTGTITNGTTKTTICPNFH
ncbi:uncharacterized protein LOC128953543 [Oppia nitens]|uniref:uncharacterized protein LOC128953543 n=1 Tax=Oppia nitens TaxID=1686743 RepID=UPI0023DA56F5|nr:uncharacterized protein LOC128953543 [Oppia nitens]